MILAYSLVSINSLMCLVLFLRKRQVNSPFQVFFLFLMLVAILPGYAHVDLGIIQFHPFSPPLLIDGETIAKAHFVILGFLAGFLFLDLIWPSQPLKLIVAEKYRTSLGFYWVIPALIIGVSLFAVYRQGEDAIYSASFEDLREGPIGPYYLTLFYLQIVIVGLPAYLILVRKDILLGLGAFLLFAYLQIAFGGSRQILFIALFMIIVLKYQKYRLLSSIAIVFAFFLTFEMLDIVLQVAKLFRNQPDMYARIALLPDLLSGSTDLSGTSSEEIIVFPMYILLTHELPENFAEFQYFFRTLLFWMPSFLDYFSVKPDDFEYDIFAFVMGGRTGTMHGTFFGNSYADAEHFFIVWVGLFTLLFKFMENMMRRFDGVEYVMLWSACVYFSVMTARGSLYAPILIAALVLVLAFVSRFLKGTSFSRNADRAVLHGRRSDLEEVAR